MSLSLTLACLWALIACIGAILPSRRNHWPLAMVLIATGLPLLLYIGWQHGPWIALALLLAAASILRWPLRYAWRWVRGLWRR